MLKSFYYGAAAVALMMVPVTAMAATAGSPGVVAASQGAAAAAVENFYAARSNAPLWFDHGRESAAAVELVSILRGAAIDGLASGPQLAGQIERSLIVARGNPRAMAEAERLMSAAWVLYVQTLRAPTPGMIYGDPGIPASAPTAAMILRDAARAPSLGAYLAQTAQVNPTYAALRAAALSETAANGGMPSPRLMANLERARAIPSTGRFVLVDAAAQRLTMYDGGRPVDSMKVIVGKLKYPTPMIASVIHYATLNPYWHVPDHLVREIIAANVVKKGQGYLKTQGYQVVADYSDDAEILSPSSVDWKAVAAGRAMVKIRQLPGRTNSLGDVKFQFANGEGIYMHDTPEKDLFAKSQRTLSNGCVRVEDATRLGTWLAGAPLRPSSTRPEENVRLAKGVPIYITYLTATPGPNSLSYVEDVYGRDGEVGAKTAALR